MAAMSALSVAITPTKSCAIVPRTFNPRQLSDNSALSLVILNAELQTIDTSLLLAVIE